VQNNAKNAQSFQDIMAYFKYLSAVLYNFPIGYHTIAFQELMDKLELLGNQQHATDA